MPGSHLRLAAPALATVTLALLIAGGATPVSEDPADGAAARETRPVELAPDATQAPSPPAATASPVPKASPSAGFAVRQHARAVTAAKDADPEESAAATAPPAGGTSPAGSAGIAAGPTHRVATRVVVPALGIDLPVMPQKTSYPACNVAMYLKQLRQPGQGGATYLYAHARRGMFLPLLTRSQVDGGSSMLGMRVEIYTGDNRRFVYRIDEVRRHVRDLRWVERKKGEALWLQTSEGPRGTIPKLQVGASLVSSGKSSHAAAHPKPRPVACG